MYIRRDYARSYYARRRRSRIPLILLVGVLTLGFLLVVNWQFDQLQNMTLNAVGLAAAPTQFPAEHAQRGVEQFVAGDLTGAEESLRRALQMRPNDVDYLYEYGRVLLELERSSEVVALGDRAIAADPGDPRGYALKALALRWSSPGEAIPIAMQGLDRNPRFTPLYAALTTAYTNIGRYAQAMEEARRGLAYDPNDVYIRRAITYPLVMLGRNGEAIEHLEMATAITPRLPGPFFELAAQFRSPQINQPRKAIAIYEHIINNLDPGVDDLAKAYLRICEVRANVRDAKFNEAERYCRRALEIKPDYGSAKRELGRMQYNRRNYEGAIISFQECAEAQRNFSDSQKDLECWGLRGLAHYWMAQCDQAWTLLNEALELAERQGKTAASDALVENINVGVYNVTQRCPGYRSVPTPTFVPPTPIPPTPIGGL